MKLKKIILFGCLLILIIGGGLFWYNRNKREDVLIKVGKLIVLPDEVPTIATVIDKNKLSGQSFFNKAENGDQVLIYSRAMKAFLYRPSIKKLIDVTTVLPSASENR